MTTMDTEVAAPFGTHANDGDTCEVDGMTYTIKCVPDDVSIFDEQGEGMWCGRIEWSRDGDYGSRKPDHFVNGRTEKLESDRHNTLWWEVPAGCVGDAMRGTRDSLCRSIKDLIQDGYCYLIVSDEDGNDDSLGMVTWDSIDIAYNANELVNNLVAARETQLNETNAVVDVWVNVGLVVAS